MIRGRKERREGGKRGRKEGRKERMGWCGGASQEGMTGSQHARDIFWLAK